MNKNITFSVEYWQKGEGEYQFYFSKKSFNKKYIITNQKKANQILRMLSRVKNIKIEVLSNSVYFDKF